MITLLCTPRKKAPTHREESRLLLQHVLLRAACLKATVAVSVLNFNSWQARLP